MREQHLRIESVLGHAPRVWLVDGNGVETEILLLAEVNAKTSSRAFGRLAPGAPLELTLTFKGEGNVTRSGDATVITLSPHSVADGRPDDD